METQTNVIILLSQSDLLVLELKLDLNLATSANDTYSSIDSDFATDNEGRTIVTVLPASVFPLTLIYS